ncbi:Holo-[acyl-carrier-protein] synthase [Bertholletia excelsa]
MEVEKGVRRWVVDISQWNPSSHDFSRAMSYLPPKEHTSISRHVKLEDRKRALVSSLLQYALVRQVLGISPDEIIIKRTAVGKPYLENYEVDLKFSNFNFNVSHHGDYVAIASEPICIVGLDIVSCDIPGGDTVS